MIFITYKDFRIPDNRIRKEFDEDKLEELTDSIAERGIIHPPVFRKTDDGFLELVAGERRVRAMRPLIDIGKQIKTAGAEDSQVAPPGKIPALLLSEMDEYDTRMVELEENVIRDDITWQEKVRAEAEINAIWTRTRSTDEKQWTEKDTGMELYDEMEPQSAKNRIRQSTLLAENLDDPMIAKADNPTTAMKLLKRKREAEVSATFADFMRENISEDEMIQMHKGDCLEGLTAYDGEPFDLFVMDPPYGIDAQTFKQGDRTQTESLFRHKYDDSRESFEQLMYRLVPLITERSAEQAITYHFCDIQRWNFLVKLYEEHGWNVWKWPMIYYKRGKGLAPSPELGPQRRYEMILYANKGKKRLRYVKSDVLGLEDSGKKMPEKRLHAASKPVQIMHDLIDRSAASGERVCDPFMGSGPVPLACKRLSMYFVGWELDEDTYNRALVRVSTDGDEVDNDTA